MQTFYPLETQIIPRGLIRRERLLPAPGEVLVEPGDLVNAADIVARCQLPGRVWVVDVSFALGVRRERAILHVTRVVGDTVQANEVLAERKGMWGLRTRTLRAPVGGQILAVRNGAVLIRTETTSFTLQAHLRGRVAHVMPETGVVISTAGASVQAVWGSGGQSHGEIRLMVHDPQQPLSPHLIDASCEGRLLVGGQIQDREALIRAADVQVRGLIVGGIDAALIPSLQQMPYPILMTEAFGAQALSRPVFYLLQSNAGREAMVCTGPLTATVARFATRRPEVLIPLDGPEEPPVRGTHLLPLQAGLLVRGLRAPYLGAVGQVTELPSLSHIVESGARVRVAEVELESGEFVRIPVVNLETIRQSQ